MADAKLFYASAYDMTVTLASLASDTNLLAGREGDAISNLTDRVLDYLVSGRIMTGTSPTDARSIQVWAVGSWDGTLWPDTFTGLDANRSPTSANHRNSITRFVASMATNNTSNVSYAFGPVSIASVFGGVVPPKWTLWVVHDTAVALNATGSNHKIRIQPIYETIA